MLTYKKFLIIYNDILLELYKKNIKSYKNSSFEDFCKFAYEEHK